MSLKITQNHIAKEITKYLTSAIAISKSYQRIEFLVQEREQC